MSERNNSTNAPAGVSRTLVILALLGTLSAFWALFLWTELVAARAGAEPFCAFDHSGACGQLWDAGFASTIHRLTGLPVAGWGLAWSIAALVLPLLTLAALADGRNTDRLVGAVQWTALGGFAGVGVMVFASAAAGLFCKSCAITYVLAMIYGGIAFYKFAEPLLPLSGVGRSVMAVAAAYALLIYPGLQTPKNTAEEGERSLQSVRTADSSSPSTSSSNTGDTSGIPAENERLLREYLASVDGQVSQFLSNVLEFHRNAKVVEQEEPRNLHGRPDAPVRITDFTDPLCGHCAELHSRLAYLESVLPAGSFNVDSRFFPLDGNCNPQLQIRGPESVRCLAVKAQICMEQTAHDSEFASQIYQAQKGLNENLVYQFAEPFMDRSTLAACVADPATAAKLADDIAYAWKFQPDGTPLVLVNGRQGSAFGPFLYVMALAGGNPDHPAFAELPAPETLDHVH